MAMDEEAEVAIQTTPAVIDESIPLSHDEGENEDESTIKKIMDETIEGMGKEDQKDVVKESEDNNITTESVERKQLERKATAPVIVPQHIDMEALKALERATEEQKRPFYLNEAVPPRTKFFGLISVDTEKVMRYSRSLPGNYPLMMDDIDKELWDKARDCFKLINRAMNSTAEAQMAKPVRELLELGLKYVQLRDEIYLQIHKQLTQCPKSEQEKRIWQIMVALSEVFPPSKTMQSYYLQQVVEKNTSRQDDVGVIARYVHKRLERLSQTGPRGYLPLLPEVERALVVPFKPSCFGVTLQEIMNNPDLVDNSGNYPKVLIFLSEAVLKLGGCTSEGIFRVPGDHAAITDLKLRIEAGNYTLPTDMREPHVPASLLKYWLRDLAEPLVPADLYEMAIVNSNNKEQAIAVLDELPMPNLLVAKYMIKFLQVIGDARNQPVTKMNVTNLALVFAPNFLRCPSENPMAILVNSKLEQCFVRTLINYLE